MASVEWPPKVIHIATGRALDDARVIRNGQRMVITTEPDGTCWQSLVFNVEAPGVPVSAWEVVEMSP